MFNQGVTKVQNILRENGNKIAEFDVSKLTAFCVSIYSNDEEKGGTQSGTQGGTQGGTNIKKPITEKELDKWIEQEIRRNSKVTTEEMAKLSGKSVRTIKRHISKLGHIQFVGSGYSGHWEISTEQG